MTVNNNNLGARLLANVASHAVDQVAALAQSSIRQASQPRTTVGAPPVQARAAGGAPASPPPPSAGRPRSQPPGDLPRRTPSLQRRAEATPQSAPRQADASPPRPGPADPTRGVVQSVQGGISAGHDIAAKIAELSHAAALDSATKKAAEQAKTAAQ